ncbi:MAG: hypothetical protein K2G92_02780, partial [Duncaniella sp.]|nr:hypothetical protein [Duncaniella sp.]
ITCNQANLQQIINIIYNKHHIMTKKSPFASSGLLLLCEKYSPGIDPDDEISKCIGHVTVLRLDIDCMTVKETIELVRKRKKFSTF